MQPLDSALHPAPYDLTVHCMLHLMQVKYLTVRCMRTRRFAALSIQRVGEVIFVAILAGLFWFQVGDYGSSAPLTDRVIADLGGLLFFQVHLIIQVLEITVGFQQKW